VVRIYRGPIVEIELRYAILWTDMMIAGGGADIGLLPGP
jgi:hypothetical protein